MRILLTGKAGQVGTELLRTLAPLGEVQAHDHATLDLADAAALRAACRAWRPQLIVNAAAYTAVDKAESETALARAINATAPGVLAEEAKRLDAVLVHYSTDYVFDGTSRAPYREDDRTAPINAYGLTKREGEVAIGAAGCKHLIFRTSWVYAPHGRNFMLTMLHLAKTREELRIVGDQRGAPTTAAWIARATAGAIRGIPPQGIASGIYNLTPSGEVSWAEFAAAIFEGAAGRPGFRAPRIVAIPSIEYPTPARRPAYSVLDGTRYEATFGPRPAWRDLLAEALAGLPA